MHIIVFLVLFGFGVITGTQSPLLVQGVLYYIYE